MVRVVNIKEYNPSADYAVFRLEQEIEDSKKMGEHALIVVHGYGSHGRGGLIKQNAVQFLKSAQHFGKIKGFVPGEMWCDTNPLKQYACEKNPELILHSQIGNLNSGVSIVVID